MKNVNTLKIVAAVALALGFGSAQAGTMTIGGGLAVGSTVTASCSAFTSTGGLAFGPYMNNQQANVDTTTTVSATCTTGTGYSIAIGAGTGYNMSTYGNWRSLTNGASHLGYAVYVNNVGNALWGDGPNAPLGSPLSATGNGIVQPYTVAGRIPGGQAAITGTYADNVTATLTY